MNKEVKLKNGQSLILRKAEINDALKLIEYLNIVGGESDNLLFGANEFSLNEEQEKAFIENINNKENSIMLIGLIDEKVVSVAQISTATRNKIAHNAEIAISVKKEYWGIGIGSEVMRALIDFAKETKKIKNISLGVKASNIRAKNLYSKFGFKEIGIHKNFFNINDEYDDEILMDLYI
ncbi:GNAT family N-acetyltransferase [Clostridium sp. CTA-7]